MSLPREVPRDAYQPYQRLPGRPEIEPARLQRRGNFTSIQVNVDSQGNNIVGDAANEPTIAVSPVDPNQIVIAWRQFDTIASDFRQAGVAYSHNAGQTWNATTLDPGAFRSDPVLDVSSTGVFYFASLSLPNSVSIFRSMDGGVTWLAPVSAFGGDKEWLAVDRSGGAGGNMYINWSDIASCCGTTEFTRSINGGASFQAPIDLASPTPRVGTMDVGSDGTLFFAGFAEDFETPAIARSSNARNDAATPTLDLAKTINLGGDRAVSGINPDGFLGQAWVAVDKSSGSTHGFVFVLSSVVPTGSNDPVDIHFVRSQTRGTSWSAPVRVNDDPPGNGAWQWFGTMAVAPNGRIDAVWNDTRNDPGGILTEVFYSCSFDAGRTWSANIPVTPAWDPSVGYPQQEKIGDYYHMVSDAGGANLAYAATLNGEQDVYFLRIPADCNNNGIDDDCDVACGPPGSRCYVPGCGLLADCNGNQVPDDCEPAEDCNHNSSIDICEIGAGLADCNANNIPDECEAMIDCNGNDNPDVCDLDSGTSQDCNGNAIPDECDITIQDCNSNMVPDDCDVASGVSRDCNSNQVPDECEVPSGTCGNSTRECLRGEDCDGTDDSLCPGSCLINCTCWTSRVFWTAEDGAIRQLSITRLDVAVLVTGLVDPAGLAADFEDGLLFLPNGAELGRSNLDGSGILYGATSYAGLLGIAVDPLRQRVYWSVSSSEDSIYRGNYDFTSSERILDFPDTVMGLVKVDLPGEKLYWDLLQCPGGQCTLGTLQRANLDGSGVETLFELPNTTILDFAVYLLGNKVYFSTIQPSRICRTDLDGSNFEVLAQLSTSFPVIALDAIAGRLFWNDSSPNRIFMGDLNAQNAVVLADHLSSSPTALVIYSPVLRRPSEDPSGIQKTRFTSFSYAPPTFTAGLGFMSALRLNLVSLHHVSPPYTGGPSVPFTSFEGQVRWVGPPGQYVESSSNPTTFYAASLQCDPYYQDWSTVGLLHVTGSAIVPSSVYEVENVAASCMGNEAGCTAVSAPLTVSTTRWGDVETPYNPPDATAQPDLADVGALVNKFRSAPGAPIKARALLAGDDTFGNISTNTLSLDFNFSHIAACVDAFRGKPYPYAVESCP